MFVCYLEPVFHLVVNVFYRRERNTMSDAIFLGKASGIYQASLGFGIAQSESQIYPGLCCRLNLSEDVVSIKRHNGLARAGLYIFAKLETEFQKRVIDWTQRSLRAGKHFLYIPFSLFQIEVWISSCQSLSI